MIAFGAVKSATLAWTMGDVGVGMMAWLNIIAILVLSNTVMKCFNDYERQLKAGIPTTEITFDPVSLGIKGATSISHPFFFSCVKLSLILILVILHFHHDVGLLMLLNIRLIQ